MNQITQVNQFTQSKDQIKKIQDHKQTYKMDIRPHLSEASS